MSNITGVMKSRNGASVACMMETNGASVACMMETNRCRCLVGKPEGNRVMGDGHQYVGRQGVDWICLLGIGTSGRPLLLQ